MTTVLAHGTFDLLHLGHVRFLEAAKGLGDRLIVSITDDLYVNKKKGMGHPIFTAQQRKEMLLALRCVDAVMIIREATGCTAIALIHPDIYAKGMDYAGITDEVLNTEEREVIQYGGRTVYIPCGDKFSSTELLERLQNVIG